MHILTKCLKIEGSEHAVSRLMWRIKPDRFVNDIQLCEVEHVVYYCCFFEFVCLGFFFRIFLLLTDV